MTTDRATASPGGAVPQPKPDANGTLDEYDTYDRLN